VSGGRHYLVNLAAQFAGRALSVGSGFLVFVLVARALGAEAFGRYSYVLAYLGVLVAIAEFGTTSVLARGMAQVRTEREVYWGNFLLLRLGLTLLAAMLGAALAPWVRPDLAPYLLAGAACLPALGSRFYEPLFQVLDRPWHGALSSGLYALAHVLGVAAALRVWGSLPAVFAAYLLANVLYAVFAFRLSLRCLRPRFQIRRSVLAPLLKLAAPIGVGTLFVTLNTRADVFLLAWLQSDTAVGLYSAAFRFYDLGAVLAVIVATPLFPIFAELATRDRAALKRLYVRIHEWVAILLLPVALLTPLVSSDVMSLAFGDRFRPAGPVLDALAWAAILIFYAQLGSALNLAVGDVTHAYWNGALAAALNIGLNLAWIPSRSYFGAAWATLLSDLLLVGVSQAYMLRNLGNVFRPGRWLGIAAASLALLVVARSGWLGEHRLLAAAGGLVAYGLTAWRLGLLERRAPGGDAG
jgi:O-antigen/teichoic acid export membrane protein